MCKVHLCQKLPTWHLHHTQKNGYSTAFALLLFEPFTPQTEEKCWDAWCLLSWWITFKKHENPWSEHVHGEYIMQNIQRLKAKAWHHRAFYKWFTMKNVLVFHLYISCTRFSFHDLFHPNLIFARFIDISFICLVSIENQASSLTQLKEGNRFSFSHPLLVINCH